ncbi:MAG: capsular biosynthesis protein [Pseudomonadota bacterium]
MRRINFNSGDGLFWSLPGGLDYTGTQDEWPDFLAGQLSAWGITDLILFGDCRPLHALAIRLARLRGIAVHVFEEGYLRPDFITLESGGVNGHSSLPRDARAYRQAAAQLPAVTASTPVQASFARRAVDDVFYNLGIALGGWRFPRYQSHRPWSAFAEYGVGVRRLPMKALTRRETERRARAIEQGQRPYFVFPLQIDADTQIRFHAAPGGMKAAIARVMQSFAAHAAPEALLVITEHPLDYGPVDFASVVASLAAAQGLGERVVFLRGGSPAALVNAARGLVTVNSTIGISALAAGIPVVTLGTAIYNLPGLTHQPHIDQFWAAPQPPDAALFDAFRRVVAARTQINGGFYSVQGIALAVEGALQRLLHAAPLPTKVDVIRYLPQPANAATPDDSQDWVPPAVVAAAEYTVQA